MNKEHNPLFKRWKKGDIRVGLVYPNTYKSGIANVGIQQIYAEVNLLEGFVCERFYGDVFNCRRSVETGTRIEDFDVLLFSVQFEEDYFKIAKFKDLKAIKVAGGPCVMENPLPLTPHFDYFYIGEIDGDVEKLLETVLSKNEDKNVLKAETILDISESESSVKVRKAELSYHLCEEIIGESVYGKSFLLEIGRGCHRACSFCVVRQIYKPCRWRNLNLLLEVAENCKKVCNKIALISPSVTDYPNIKELMWELINMGFEVSPSSIRADTIDEEIAELLYLCGQKSFTVAPETSERLRKVLRKGISDEDIFRALELVKGKLNNVKLYYMIGIPKESEEDISSIVELTEKVKKDGFKVTVSVNPLVPKPHTPLQFAPFGGFNADFCDVVNTLKKRLRQLLRLRKLGIKVSVEKVEDFAVQTILSRGNREVGEHLKFGKKAMLRKFPELLKELDLERKHWEFLDHGYSFKKLRKEYEILLEKG